MIHQAKNLLHMGLLGITALRNYPNYIFHKLSIAHSPTNPGIARNFFYSQAIIDFSEAMAEHDLLTTCNLSQDSIVFDVGGYRGDWASAIVDKYDPSIYIFEPLPTAFRALQEKFHNHGRIFIYPHGLADENTAAMFNASEMGSSIYASAFGIFRKSRKIPVELKDIFDFIQNINIQHVDLIKINIEGGEYQLLPRMIETGIIDRFKTVRVQFHEWIPGARKARRWIRQRLSETHEIEWDYPFVWESWRRKAE